MAIRTVARRIRTVVVVTDCREKERQVPVHCAGSFVNAPRIRCAVHCPYPVLFTRFSRSSGFPVCREKRENKRQMNRFTDGLLSSFDEMLLKIRFE